MTKNLLHVLHGRRDVEGCLEIMDVRRGRGRGQRVPAALLYLALPSPSCAALVWMGGRRGGPRLTCVHLLCLHLPELGEVVWSHLLLSLLCAPGRALLSVCAQRARPGDSPLPPLPPPPQGVYAGGVESASELVRSRQAVPGEFKLLAGYSGWGPWQLAGEMDAGTWWAVAASQDLILDILTGGWAGGVSGREQGPACLLWVGG